MSSDNAKCGRDRVILHCDMNGFYAAVELLQRPDLKDRPMAVSGDPDSRHGIILAKNQLAKEYGVVTAETIWQAKKKCPQLVLVRPHMEKYRHYCGLINEIYQRFTDMVEPFSIDESWLDVTASQKLFGSGRQIADTIRRTVREELGMTLSAGVSFNKTFAKMGSEYKKPDATTEITRENFRELLWPLPAGELFGVGKATSEKLRQAGIFTIGDIAASKKPLLVSLFGKQGAVMWNTPTVSTTIRSPCTIRKSRSNLSATASPSAAISQAKATSPPPSKPCPTRWPAACASTASRPAASR